MNTIRFLSIREGIIIPFSVSNRNMLVCHPYICVYIYIYLFQDEIISIYNYHCLHTYTNCSISRLSKLYLVNTNVSCVWTAQAMLWMRRGMYLLVYNIYAYILYIYIYIYIREEDTFHSAFKHIYIFHFWIYYNFWDTWNNERIYCNWTENTQ